MNSINQIIRSHLYGLLNSRGLNSVLDAIVMYESLTVTDQEKLATAAKLVQMRAEADRSPKLDLDIARVACLLYLKTHVPNSDGAFLPDVMTAFLQATKSSEKWANTAYIRFANWQLIQLVNGYFTLNHAGKVPFEQLAIEYGLQAPSVGATHLHILKFLALLYQKMGPFSGIENENLWPGLTAGDVVLLVDFAIEVFKASFVPRAYLAQRVLAKIACLVPEKLLPHHAAIADAGIYQPGVIFYRAGSIARDHLLARASEGAGNNAHIGIALAFIGDEVVRELASAEEAEEAGWELESSGDRRMLYFDECFELSERDTPSTSEPVSVITSTELACPACQRPIWCLFDFDLRDQRLSFLQLSPKRSIFNWNKRQRRRLRFLMCKKCVRSAGIVYSKVNVQGAAQVVHIKGGAAPGDPSADDSIPQRILTLGKPRATPLQAAYGGYAGRPSQIGGFPHWLQDADYPACNRCQRRMKIVGQVSGLDIRYGDAMYYAFLCDNCGITAVSSQQS